VDAVPALAPHCHLISELHHVLHGLEQPATHVEGLRAGLTRLANAPDDILSDVALIEGLEAGTAPKAHHGGSGGCGGNELATIER
jgi:hypothetical protein